MAEIEMKCSPNLTEDQMPLPRNEAGEADRQCRAFILALVAGCKSIYARNYNEPMMLTFFLDPVGLAEQGVLLWHSTADNVLCLSSAARARRVRVMRSKAPAQPGDRMRAH
jgi:hypothetical protein